MKKWMITSLFGIAIVLSACGGNNTAGNEPSGANEDTTGMSEAEEVYQNNCAYCHGSDLSGGAGPDITKVGSRYSQEEIADIIKNGKGKMPADVVKGDKVELLASWLAQKK